MTEKVSQIAPTAREGGAAAAAAVEGLKAKSRSAHSDPEELARGVTIMAGHGRKVARDGAGDDADSFRLQLRLQGEILLMAGMQLIGESGDL
jgi:hypothetical protein